MVVVAHEIIPKPKELDTFYAMKLYYTTRKTSPTCHEYDNDKIFPCLTMARYFQFRRFLITSQGGFELGDTS